MGFEYFVNHPLENFKLRIFDTKGHWYSCAPTVSLRNKPTFKGILNFLICKDMNLLPVSETWSHANETRACRILLYWSSQSKESMVFHSTLPEVLTGLRMVHPEDKGVLLLFTLSKIGMQLDPSVTEQCLLYSTAVSILQPRHSSMTGSTQHKLKNDSLTHH